MLETRNGGTNGTGFEEWLPRDGKAGTRPLDTPLPELPQRREKPAAPAPERDLEVEHLRADLHDAQRRAAAAEERAHHLERQLRDSRRAAEEARRAAETRATRLAAAQAGDGGELATGALDLNHATFEALRALGLSVSQSARFIGQRDEGHGFRSLDDLDRLYGLPADVIALLKAHGTI